MGSYVTRTRIAAAPEKVFAALVAPGNGPALFTGAERDQVSPPGALKLGSRLTRRRTVEGTTVEGESTVEVCREGKELVLCGETKGFRIEQRWVLRADEGGTKVEYECSIKGSGLAAFMEGMVVEAAEKADADHLTRLKGLVEGG